MTDCMVNTFSIMLNLNLYRKTTLIFQKVQIDKDLKRAGHILVHYIKRLKSMSDICSSSEFNDKYDFKTQELICKMISKV